MRNVRRSGSSLLVVLLLALAASPSTAQSQNNIAQSAAATCAVMSGQRKADRQSLQYLSLLDQDLADANPVALALYREVNKQCPKAYLKYQQSKRVNNPFPAGSLVKTTPSQLVNSEPGPEFPIRCHGARGMASTDGKNLIVDFARGDRAADQALQPGQCSWPDRGVRPNEPTRIANAPPTAADAQRIAARINAGETWTFWVVNTGTLLKATASAKGTPTQKP
jgi:hypothetical protein